MKNFTFLGLSVLALTAALSACGQTPSTFQVTTYSSEVSAPAGGTAKLPIGLGTYSNFSGDVTITLKNAPAGITAQPLVLKKDSKGVYKGELSINVAPNAPIGVHTLTVNAKSGDKSIDTTAVLTVTDSTFEFTMHSTEATAPLGAGTKIAVALAAYGVFDSDVTITLKNAPAGITAQPLVLKKDSKGVYKGELSINVAQSAAIKSHPLALNATSGAVSKDASVTLNVTDMSLLPYTISGTLPNWTSTNGNLRAYISGINYNNQITIQSAISDTGAYSLTLPALSKGFGTRLGDLLDQLRKQIAAMPGCTGTVSSRDEDALWASSLWNIPVYDQESVVGDLAQRQLDTQGNPVPPTPQQIKQYQMIYTDRTTSIDLTLNCVETSENATRTTQFTYDLQMHPGWNSIMVEMSETRDANSNVTVNGLAKQNDGSGKWYYTSYNSGMASLSTQKSQKSVVDLLFFR